MTKHTTSANGNGRYQNEKVRVAIIGVGNCANAFVQGVQFYKDADPTKRVPGLMHVDLGGYHVGDIEFSAAFDIDADKVGKDLSEAIWSGQNNTIKFVKEDVPHLGVPVQRGMTHDGLGKYLSEKITKAPGSTVDIVQVLKDTKTDVVVSYLPVGSEQATKWYVEQILEAGCGFVNCIPVFIAREQYWNNRFTKAGLPIVGDDIKSQVGATIVHRALARLFGDRGVELQRTSQLNVGGNMDFYNMLERERLESKKISKTNAVTSIVDHEMPATDVHVGPSDYVPWLTDRKWAHIRLEGAAFGEVPLMAELKLEVWDSPNSAGIVIDAARCCKLAMNHGVGGQLDGPSSYLMKSPMNQRPDDEAREDTEEFIARHARTEKVARAAREKAEKAEAGRRRPRRSPSSSLQRAPWTSRIGLRRETRVTAAGIGAGASRAAKRSSPGRRAPPKCRYAAARRCTRTGAPTRTVDRGRSRRIVVERDRAAATRLLDPRLSGVSARASDPEVRGACGETMYPGDDEEHRRRCRREQRDADRVADFGRRHEQLGAMFSTASGIR